MFGALPGVIRTRVGYCGGSKKSPSYHSIGDHTETIQIDYDEKVTSYEKLLNVFWSSHNPHATPWGKQYMSAVFYHDDKQKSLVDETRTAIEKKTGRAVKTSIQPISDFYMAEGYHQKYYLQQHRHSALLAALKLPDFTDLTHSHAATRINSYVSGYGTAQQLKQEIASFNLTAQAAAKLTDVVSRRSGKSTCGGA